MVWKVIFSLFQAWVFGWAVKAASGSMSWGIAAFLFMINILFKLQEIIDSVEILKKLKDIKITDEGRYN
jgi:hypothetical protein